MQEFQCIFLIITSLAPTTDRDRQQNERNSNLKSNHIIILQSRRFLSDTSTSVSTLFFLLSSFIALAVVASGVINVIERNKLLAYDAAIAYLEKNALDDDPALKNKIGKFNTFHFVHNNHFLPRITIIISPKKFFSKEKNCWTNHVLGVPLHSEKREMTFVTYRENPTF